MTSATIVRACVRCGLVLPVAEFRDEGDVRRGRPPKICRYCRAKDPALQEHAERNRSRRPGAVRQQRSYGSRSPAEIHEATRTAHPTGFKVCPTYSGCGAQKSVADFGDDRFQHDGLTPLCAECETTRQKGIKA